MTIVLSPNYLSNQPYLWNQSKRRLYTEYANIFSLYSEILQIIYHAYSIITVCIQIPVKFIIEYLSIKLLKKQSAIYFDQRITVALIQLSSKGDSASTEDAILVR